MKQYGPVRLLSSDGSRVIGTGRLSAEADAGNPGRWFGDLELFGVARPHDPSADYPEYLLPAQVPQLPDGDYILQFDICGGEKRPGSLVFESRTDAKVRGRSGPLPRRRRAGTGRFYAIFEVWHHAGGSPGRAHLAESGFWIFIVEAMSPDGDLGEHVVGVYGPMQHFGFRTNEGHPFPDQPDILKWGELEFERGRDLLAEADLVRNGSLSPWYLQCLFEESLIDYLRSRIPVTLGRKIQQFVGG